MSRFRLIDLLTAGGCGLLILTLTVAARRQSQEFNAIAECATNLKRIGQALVQYQELSGGAFPRTRYDAAAPVAAYTSPDAADPFAADGPAANDVTAAAFLLARVTELPAPVFACPAALRHGLAEIDSFTEADVLRRSNFRARVNYNYAMANMYADATAGYSLSDFTKLPGGFAVVADTNPGGDGVAAAKPDMPPSRVRMSNSPNHQREGQNVLLASGAVRFERSPFVGLDGDNVYAARGTFPAPADGRDSVLLPVWSMGPDRIPRSVKLRRWVLGGGTVVVMAGLAALVVRSRIRGQNLPG
jgi:hypothetical protein